MDNYISAGRPRAGGGYGTLLCLAYPAKTAKSFAGPTPLTALRKLAISKAHCADQLFCGFGPPQL